MQKLIKSGLFACLLVLAAGSVQAQVIVHTRPARPTVVVTKTPAPAHGHVWVDDDWSVQGNKYVWKGGYWSAPPRNNAVYQKGYWKHNKKGWHWVPGRWK